MRFHTDIAYLVGIGVLITVTTNGTMIWDVMPCNVVQLKFSVVSEERNVSVMRGEE
jgi:hypothetical protein